MEGKECYAKMLKERTTYIFQLRNNVKGFRKTFENRHWYFLKIDETAKRNFPLKIRFDAVIHKRDCAYFTYSLEDNRFGILEYLLVLVASSSRLRSWKISLK